MADSYLSIPSNQYFLTSSADGSYVSSDFYLRLAGKITQMMKGEIAIRTHHEVPLLAGPVWLRTSFEKGLDALPAALPVKGPYSLSKEKAASGSHSLKINGPVASECVLFEVNIPILSSTRVTYKLYPINKQSMEAGIYLITSDGEK
jgi:hypothetical protein